MLRGVLEAQAPPKQNASDTISTYSSRLLSATLLEDRREAILGLRSFSKEYPASVASGGLRGLISSLTKDTADVDTGKIVLETLLALFNPNEDSPEADDDIALWVADQFSQRQDNITVLLDILENDDYYARLYSLRLLGEICSARPERTQECILSAPLGTARLVAVLDDSRDAVRGAGLFLLNEVLSEVTEWSFELQKIIAFEDAFERIFNLIEAEGSLAFGGIVVQDCLTLLANLLRFNASNQALFREPRILSRLARLFDEDEQEENEDEALGPNENKEKNIWGVLAVIRMFLPLGNSSTATNQAAFANSGIFSIILQLSFTSALAAPTRAEALKTSADIIRGNERLQERFANNQVQAATSSPSPTSTVPNGDSKSPQPGSRAQSQRRKPKQQETVYVMEALLDLVLKSSSIAMFDVRLAATECITAYFYDYTPARHHFLRHAINLHHAEAGSEDASSNAITVLLAGPHGFPRNDPYRIWFASLLALRLVHSDPEAKATLRAVAEGDESKGEEVVPAVQLITGNLIAAYHEDEDDRVIVAYLQLLCGLLYEHSESVNDLLSEGSTVQELIKIASKPTQNHELTQGLAAVLLGIVYEFSTKDSPIPRRSLQPLLQSNLGLERYKARLSSLRAQPELRDFEVLPQSLASSPGQGLLPEVYFDATFVEFLKDNFSRLLRAIERDPGLEAVQKHEGIDRDLVDQLRGQISDKSAALEKAQADIQGLGGQLASAQGEQHKASESLHSEIRRLNLELTRIKNVNDSLQRGHEAELEQFSSRHKAELSSLVGQHDRQLKTAQDKHAKELNEADAAARQRAGATEGSLRAQMSNLEQKTSGLERALQQERQKQEHAQSAVSQHLETIKRHEQGAQQKDSELDKLRARVQELEGRVKAATQELERSAEKLATSERDAAARVFEAEGQVETVRTEMRNKLEDAARKAEGKESSVRQEHEKWQSRLQAKVNDKDKKIEELNKELTDKEQARADVQGELDDLLIVLGDIEEKRTRDKAKLKELGADISDDDEDDDEDEDEDGDEEEEEEEEPKVEEKKPAKKEEKKEAKPPPKKDDKSTPKKEEKPTPKKAAAASKDTKKAGEQKGNTPTQKPAARRDSKATKPKAGRHDRESSVD